MTITDIPVYLFTGFLESGKTKFIQETLEDYRFNNGEKTLLLVCEEGMEEYDPEAFSSPNVFLEYIEDENDLKPKNLTELQKKHKVTRVIVEYNGVWMLKSLFDNLPKNWLIAQEFMFVNSDTFLNYNTNMRSLVVDKLNTCELVVFNRFRFSYDKMQFHKIVRGTSRRTDIAYEDVNGEVEYDDIEDPLPFDINAPVIEIEDGDYALWYRDIGENMENYNGKTVRFKCLVNKKTPSLKGLCVVGRNVMTCCVQDIQFAGLVCKWENADGLSHKQWVYVKAKISIENNRIYGRSGPVLNAEEITPAKPPVQEVATFF